VPYATLETGHFLGLNYLFDGRPRRTQIYCVKSTHLLVFNKKALIKVNKVKDANILDYKMKILEKVPYISELGPSIRKRLVGKLKEETRIRFSYLYREGELADKVYLIVKGQFLVSKKLVYCGGKDPV